MSHFTVLVKVTPERLSNHNGDVESAVGQLLAPYQENNMGDCPDEYLEFHDEEDEYLNEFETESTEMVRLESGEHVYPWDERFRVKGTIGTGSDTHKVPDHLEKVQLSHKDRYGTLEKFANDWHGMSARDEKTGRYGYWENPNKKWDWWTIGGRWSGRIPVKSNVTPVVGSQGVFGNQPEPGHADVAAIKNIDFDAVAETARKKCEEAWDRWVKLVGAPETLDGYERFTARDQALALGLLAISKTEPPKSAKCSPWSDKVPTSDERHGWFDVYRDISQDEFMREFVDHFNPLTTYAALDDDGWHAPGEMGWWGCSSDTPNENLTFKREFVRRFIKGSDPETVLVVVDCHI